MPGCVNCSPCASRAFQGPPGCVGSNQGAPTDTIMTQTVRKALLLEVAVFSVAALIHAGWLIAGYQHREAKIA